MKQVSVFCGLVIVLWSIVACQVYADTITLVADEWCPYNCVPESDTPGYMIEIAKKVFELKGYSIVYEILPWARAVQDTRLGRYTAIVGAYQGDAPDFIFPANELGQINQSFFVTTESSWNYTGIESLAHIVIGVIKDYAYGDELDAYIDEHKSDPHNVQVVAGTEALTTNIQKMSCSTKSPKWVCRTKSDRQASRFRLKKHTSRFLRRSLKRRNMRPSFRKGLHSCGKLANLRTFLQNMGCKIGNNHQRIVHLAFLNRLQVS